MGYKRVSPQPVVEGGTGAATLTGVLIGNGTSAVTGNAVTQHDLLIGGASNAITSVAPSATSGVPVISQGAAADPAFGTAVVAGGGTGATSFNTNGVVISNTTGTGALAALSLTSGQLVIGGTTTPAAATLTAGTNISITNGNNTITIAGTGAGGFSWSVITANQTAAVNNGYICNKAGTLALALPATSAVGDMIRVTGINTATGWQITQAAGQQIFIGTSSTTSGATGTLTSSAIRDSIEMVCTATNTTWQVLSVIGNITVV